MSDDPTIDEVRAVRSKISEECGHDPSRLVAHLMELQKKYADRLVASPAGGPPQSDDDESREEAA